MCWALWWFDAEAQLIAVGHHSKPRVFGGRLKPMCWALWWFDAEAQLPAVGHHSKPPVFEGEAETHVLGPLVV